MNFSLPIVAVALALLACPLHAQQAVEGRDGWLFFQPELRFLSAGKFWGASAAKVSRSSKPEAADPLPAIVDFHRQLVQRGIALLLVPVPGKAAIYPGKLATEGADAAAPVVQEFYAELRKAGVAVLDLRPVFQARKEDERGPLYCRTDTHWSGVGVLAAAESIAKLAAELVPGLLQPADFATAWTTAKIVGDLGPLLPEGVARPTAEEIAIRTVTAAGGVPLKPDPASPVVLMGDSHTLVFHDLLARNAGLPEQLAAAFGFPVDLIGTRGSGATSVRISLYRKSTKNPEYLAGKKLVIWCFTEREFTEAPTGWAVLPIVKGG